jgi:hypothetical protein
MVNGPGPLNPAIACASCPTRLQSEMYEPVTVVEALFSATHRFVPTRLSPWM